MNEDKNASEEPTELKPGETISPSHDSKQTTTALKLPGQATGLKSEPAKAVQPVPPAPAVQKAKAPKPGSFQAQVSEQPEVASRNQSEDSQNDSINWTASEFIAHHKTVGWYLAVILAAIVLAALVWLATKDKISAAVVVVAAIALAAYGSRQPRQLEYGLDQNGLTAGRKQFAYGEFRSFAIIEEGAFASVVFIPLKRFAPLVAAYFELKDENKIVSILSNYLPMENREHDMVDRFMRRIRF
jgi:hypothetical protein